MSPDLRLAIPAAVGWVAAAIVIVLPGLPFALGFWLLAGLLTVVALRSHGWALVAMAAVAAALCCTSAAVQAPVRQPAVLLEAAEHSRTVTVAATTTQTALPGSTSFEVRLDNVDGVSVAVPALAFGESASQRLGIGTSVVLTGTLTAAEPGDDIAFLLFPQRPPEVIAPPPWYLEWANQLRARFLAEATALPGAGGDLLAGLAIGDTSAVSDELDAAMKSASLTHLTAVSGANCAIVIGLIMAAGAAIGVRRGLRIAASVVVLIGFVILVTPEPSVLRAAVMAALVLVALGGGRPVRGLPVLSLATLVLLISDPWLARSYGFVLSVLATAGLLLLAGPLASALERWMPRPIALLIAVPVAAQLACQPVIIMLNASLPTYGVVANLLAAPAAPVATVVGLAACLLLALSPPLGLLLCQLAWVPSAWIAAVASFFAGLPGAKLPWPSGLLGVGMLVALTALVVAAVLTRRRWVIAGLLVALVAYAGLAGGSRMASQLSRPDWQIAMCDVGQGDASLVRSDGLIALIDTGPEPARLSACLESLGVTHLDLLVLTHYDLDHIGGAQAVVGMAERVLVGPSGGPDDDLIVANLVAGGATAERVSRGLTGMLGDLRWQVLWPPTRLAGIEPGNSASVTVEFDPVGECPNGCLSSIFLGDLGRDAQSRVLAANPQLARVDVVKVSHHGSADQSPPLYDRLGATVGMIGVGVDNGYGHPTDDLLAILDGAGTPPVRTDLNGLILLAPGATPQTVTVWTER